MTFRSIASAIVGQKKIVRFVEELGLNKEDAQRLLGKGGDLKSRLRKLLAPPVQEFSVSPNIVVVPDLSAVELTALTKRELNLTYCSPDNERWDYYRDFYGNPIRGRGLKFETLIYTPELGSGETIASERARDYLRERGFYGHVGAFTQWRRTCGLEGYHASIPEDGACYRCVGDGLFAPCSCFDGGHRVLCQRWLDRGWPDLWSFVAFREV